MRHGLPTRVGKYDTFCWLYKVWEEDRNSRGYGVDRQFANVDARIKLRRLYPKIAP